MLEQNKRIEMISNFIEMLEIDQFLLNVKPFICCYNDTQNDIGKRTRDKLKL